MRTLGVSRLRTDYTVEWALIITQSSWRRRTASFTDFAGMKAL
jgi:hypothetical protein